MSDITDTGGPRLNGGAQMGAGLVRRFRGRTVAALLLLSSCGQGESAGPGGAIVITEREETEVVLGTCPDTTDTNASKIANEQYFDALREGQTSRATIWLRSPISEPVDPSCGFPESASTTDCETSDTAIAQRAELVKHEVNCVLSSLNSDALIFNRLTSTWFEKPYYSRAGAPTPLLVAFTETFTASQIFALQRHPFVERITTAPGDAADKGLAAPPRLAECPDIGSTPDGPPLRKPRILELKDAGFLPPSPSCDAQSCDSATFGRAWGRALENKRQLACVQLSIDGVVNGSKAARLSYVGGDAYDGVPRLPPLNELTATVLSLGFTLTDAEVRALQAHPYVESVRDQPGLDPVGDPPADCQSSVKEIPERQCPSEFSDAPQAKYSSQDAIRWQQTTGVTPVHILVSDGAQVCPLPACGAGQRDCAAVQALVDYWTEQNRASQRCVRALLLELGGAADPEVRWSVNMIRVSLTWPQIQIVATHPHTVSVQAAPGPGSTL